jgi:hypothetical protein
VGQAQLSLFECVPWLHVVREDCFQSVEGCWSPYFVSVCVRCGKVFGWPRIGFLFGWPSESVRRLVKVVEPRGDGAVT